MLNLKTKFSIIFSSFLLLSLQASFCYAENIYFEINPGSADSTEQKPLSYEIKPTKSIEDIMTVRNNSDETINLRVYAVDSLQSSDGGVAYKLQNANQESIGTWLKLTREYVELGPHKSASIPYTLTIPEKVTPGTYQGALVAELISKPTDLSENKNVKIVSRLTETIYISIPGRKIIDYSLDQFSLWQDKNNPCFYIKFLNKGNVFLKTAIDLRIEGLLLSKPYEINLNHPTILQGDTFEKNISFLNPPLFGNYQATINIKVSEYNVATGKLKELHTITKTISFNIIPYPLIAALLVLIIIIIIAEHWRRSNNRKNLNNTFTHAVTRGETIISIADLYQLNWRTIAKLNKLKKPYALRPGRKLILTFPKTKKSS